MCGRVQCGAVLFSEVNSTIVQFSVVRQSKEQYSIVQCSKVQLSVVQCSKEQYSIVQCRKVQFSVVQCSKELWTLATGMFSLLKILWYSTIQYTKVQCVAIQCSTLQCSIPLPCSLLPSAASESNAVETIKESPTLHCRLHCPAVPCGVVQSRLLESCQLHCSRVQHSPLRSGTLIMISLLREKNPPFSHFNNMSLKKAAY